MVKELVAVYSMSSYSVSYTCWKTSHWTN